MMKFPPQAAFSVFLVGLVLAGCTQQWTTRLALPAGHELVRGQLVFHSDFPLASQHRLFEELTVRRGDVLERLQLPVSDEPIHVYLFDDADQFAGFVRLYHPEYPQRRAFFLETDTRLVVYAQWGDRVAEDLRHEVTHAYLHAVVPNLPLWLDEGLAEYYEVPRGLGGRNRDHLQQLEERLNEDIWRPDLARLEALDPHIEMSSADYAESWAWVHFLLEAPIRGRAILPHVVADLRHRGTTLPVSVRVRQELAHPDRALVEHIRRLAAENHR